MPRRLLTHTDLDGIGCAVLFAGAASGGAGFELVENGQIDGRVRAALASGADILVTDHGVSEETADLVDDFVARGGRFSLLDHHRSALPLAARGWAVVDESRSATGLLFDHLGRPPAFEEFARLVEDHDLWRHEDPRSERLAALVGLLGHERFLERFRDDPAVSFREGELLLLENAERRREDFLRKKVEQARVVERGGERWAVCYAEDYQSDLAERLMNDLGVTSTAIVNPGKRTVSLRSRGGDVSVLARRFGGGGHARAAAFSFRGSELETRLEEFERALDGELDGVQD
jgi:uncharacterized protein